MKTLTVLISIVALLGLFGSGILLTAKASVPSEVTRIHLTCWSTENSAPIERVRLTLDQNLKGLVWLANFSGAPTGEGQISGQQDTRFPASLSLNITSQNQAFEAQLPRFVFQPHVHALQMKVTQGETSSALECRKINLQDHT